MMKATAKILRDSAGHPSTVEITRAGRTLKVEYNTDEGFVLEGQRGIMPSVAELIRLVHPSVVEIEKINTIGTISLKGIDTMNDRNIIKQWLHDGCYTERWEQGFRRELYHGRTGSYWLSESRDNTDFGKWTLPEILPAGNPIGVFPWNNALRMRNTKNELDVDEVYVGFPKAHQAQVMMFEAKLPTPGSLTNLYAGFEINSGGAFAHIVTLVCYGGTWKLHALNYKNVLAITNDVTLNYNDAWARYALLYDPPIFELWQSTVANRNILEMTDSLDLGAIRGKAISFFANEHASTTEFLVGNIWVHELQNQACGTPIVHNLTLTNKDTEYPYTFPTGTQKFSFHERDHKAFYFAFETGKVAGPTEPYMTGHEATQEDFAAGDIKLGTTTIYFSAPLVNGRVIEILSWF